MDLRGLLGAVEAAADRVFLGKTVGGEWEKSRGAEAGKSSSPLMGPISLCLVGGKGERKRLKRAENFY